MGDELGWSAERRKQEVEATKEYFMTMGISTEDDAVRADFDAMELVKYRRVFSEYTFSPLHFHHLLSTFLFSYAHSSMDRDKNGVLTEAEVQTAFTNMCVPPLSFSSSSLSSL